MDMELKDRVAIVTGGGRGIGRAIALAYAEAGAKVVVAARSEAELHEVAGEIEAGGGKGLAVVTDLSIQPDIEAMVDAAMAEYGRVDILVNNSGIEGPIMNVAEMDMAGWAQTLAVNLTGAMLAAKHVLAKSMVPNEAGVIINVSSISGRKGPPTRAAYSSSKFGMIGLTQTLAMEGGRHGIRVNCITPGLVEGARIERVMQAASQRSGRPYEEVVATINRRSALNRMVTAAEVANLALFLASDKSSGITGQTINCDAGLEMD
jgi:NAD(P)-dependent dehydrogenase (short-subunit alcohol dehydrogenase family)